MEDLEQPASVSDIQGMTAQELFDEAARAIQEGDETRLSDEGIEHIQAKYLRGGALASLACGKLLLESQSE